MEYRIYQTKRKLIKALGVLVELADYLLIGMFLGAGLKIGIGVIDAIFRLF